MEILTNRSEGGFLACSINSKISVAKKLLIFLDFVLYEKDSQKYGESFGTLGSTCDWVFLSHQTFVNLEKTTSQYEPAVSEFLTIQCGDRNVMKL